MKKKVLIICSICFILYGCNDKTTNTYEIPINFLFASPLSNHKLWLQAKAGMETACEELKVYCDWKGPTNINTSQMEDVILTGMLQKTNGIITQGVIDPELIKKGKDQNIPFVLVDSDIKGSEPLVSITKDFRQQAELLLKDIQKTLGKESMLYIGIQVSELTFDLAKEQIDAVKEEFKKHPGGYEITAVSESKSDKLHSIEEWQKVLNYQMNVALNFSGESAGACIEALEASKIDKRILVYGVDDMSDTIDYIKQGKIKGSVVTSFYKYGYDAVHILYNAVVEKKAIKDQDIAANILMVNQDNVKQYQEELNR